MASRSILSAGNAVGVTGGNTDDSAQADNQNDAAPMETSAPMPKNLTAGQTGND